MELYFLPKSKINLLMEEILGEFTVFGPKQKDIQFVFEEISHPEELRLDYNTSILPPVKTFFPNNEKLIAFNLNNIDKTEIVTNENRKILFGVHPCDINAIKMMDEIFAKPPQDEHYLARRKETIIIGLNCKKPCGEKTLCYDKGTYKADSGFDLMFWETHDGYVVQVVSNLGKYFTAKFSYFFNFFTEFTENFYDFVDNFQSEQEQNFTKKLTHNIFELPEALRETYDSELWHEIGAKCLSCGSCNIVCPTCYCFDVHDVVDLDLEGGHRCRNWDSCQNIGFACVGSGENFREKSSQRNRHRVFKKEVYLPQNQGFSGCVGCGRCNNVCIAGISLIEIYNRAFELQKNQEEQK
ncbi:4Fe-4S dicluster domain-containing protein [bacterium]|nr:4Fe-4S dicluster domain-containing protein [bacterium]